jgi:hypothetical protein
MSGIPYADMQLLVKNGGDFKKKRMAGISMLMT